MQRGLRTQESNAGVNSQTKCFRHLRTDFSESAFHSNFIIIQFSMVSQRISQDLKCDPYED